MLIGTSCRFSARFCAVTMTSSSVVVSCAEQRRAGEREKDGGGDGGAGRGETADAFGMDNRHCHSPVMGPVCDRDYDESRNNAKPAGNDASRLAQRRTPQAAGHVRVRGEHGTECGLERTQPGFVVPPLLDAVPVDGLADLLGARRAHRTLVLEEAQAARLERQTAVVEQPAHLGLGVLDHALVDDAVDASRQHRVEVRHELDVVAIEAAHVREVVAEVLAARVVLLEVREAAGQRMAAGVDDLRVRQHEVDHPDVQEVVRHLVDEERAIRLAMDARALDVALAELPQLARLPRAPAPRRRRAMSSRFRPRAQFLAPS